MSEETFAKLMECLSKAFIICLLRGETQKVRGIALVMDDIIEEQLELKKIRESI